MEALNAYAKLFSERPDWAQLPEGYYWSHGCVMIGSGGWGHNAGEPAALALCRMEVMERLIDAGHEVRVFKSEAGFHLTIDDGSIPVNFNGDTLDTALVAAARAMGEKRWKR